MWILMKKNLSREEKNDKILKTTLFFRTKEMNKNFHIETFRYQAA